MEKPETDIQIPWSQTSTTKVVSTDQHRCLFPLKNGSCRKVFSRPCDLRRHEKYHTKPVKCLKCKAGFASAKDLKRHVDRFSNWTGCHSTSTQETEGPRLKYLCPHPGCKHEVGAISDRHGFGKLQLGASCGFSRRDRWQAHLKNLHRLCKSEIEGLAKKGIPTAVYDDAEGFWELHAADGIVITEANLRIYRA
ncbi:hypothetical protein BP6252_12816 [Coleophoma cylindrospora]|uniref:C2H2-type domain-containing protein n=1 Tax=Coleophoma cylindrospora TaxID=1849047 RepID=A0A3D8QD47_9HELO|nr:hypothetical protein BP6252_12816 [Coleophoma cylindrospora]